MPPQISFSKDRIVEEAFEIVRNEGLNALTARKIAERLNSSTQPIYSAFGAMKDLKAAVVGKAKRYAIQYLLQEEESPEPFLNIGLRYVRFAKEEQELFKLLYIAGSMSVDFEDTTHPFNSLIERMKEDPHLQGLDETALKRINVNMWIYTHGLTSLMNADPSKYSDEFVYQYLRQMGRIVIEWEHFHQQKGEQCSVTSEQ